MALGRGRGPRRMRAGRGHRKLEDRGGGPTWKWVGPGEAGDEVAFKAEAHLDGGGAQERPQGRSRAWQRQPGNEEVCPGVCLMKGRATLLGRPEKG